MLKKNFKAVDKASKKRTAKRTVQSESMKSDIFPSNMDNELQTDLDSVMMLSGKLNTGNVPINGDHVFMNAALMDSELNSGASLTLFAADGRTVCSLANFKESAAYRIKITRAKENQTNKKINGQFIFYANGDNNTVNIETEWEEAEETVEYIFVPFATDLKNIRSAVLAKTPKMVPNAIEFNTSSYDVSIEVVSKSDIAAYYQQID